MSAYKSMAKEAKGRIVRCAGEDLTPTNAIFERSYNVCGKFLSKDELAYYVGKIAEIIRSGDEVFAIGRLLGKYADLDANDPMKQHFVLDISKLYCEAKEYLKDNIKNRNLS